ncbi:hypothetical protein ACGCUR_01100 [Eubacteriales bacterium KG126]
MKINSLKGILFWENPDFGDIISNLYFKHKSGKEKLSNLFTNM